MRKAFFAVLACGLITGCSHSSGTSSSDHGTASNNASSTSQSTSDKPSGQTSTTSKVDPTTPLTSYNKPTDPSWLTYILVSRLSPQPSDEEKMKLFSPAYYNESDTFKKHDILTTGLPKVNSTLDEYKAQSYYAFQSKDPFSLNGLALLKPYDFGTQSFQLEDCAGASLNNQGVVLRLSLTPAMCNVKVMDTNTARAIEDLRAHSQLVMKFTTYFFVDGVDASRNEVDGTITHLHIDFNDIQSNRTIASFDIN